MEKKDMIQILDKLELIVLRARDSLGTSGATYGLQAARALDTLAGEIHKESVLLGEGKKEKKNLVDQGLDLQLNQCCNWLEFLVQGLSGPTVDKITEYLRNRDIKIAMDSVKNS